jgi:hypothetical protein
MGFETWKRDLIFRSGRFKRTALSNITWTNQRIIGAQTTISDRSSYYWRAQKILHSHGPRYARQREQLAMFDLGHGFTTTKHTYKEVTFPISWTNNSVSFPRTANGILTARNSDVVNGSHSIWPTATPLDNAFMIGAGTIGIARCQPSNPAANLSIALAELLRDRPRLPGKEFKRRPGVKSTADEYLNYVFGIAPTIKDAKDLYDAFQNSEAILAQYHRDSGKHVRRSYRFPVTEDVTVEDLGVQTPQPSPLVGVEPWNTQVPLIREITTRRELWFAGCFTYHIPGLDTILDRFRAGQQELNRLYGIKFTPDVAYALTPYSWLADWFGSMGPALENASNFSLSNQVMHYGYVMCTTTVTHKYTLRSSQIPLIGYDLVQEYSTVIKQRLKATPYGFGLNPQAFTEQQWAILAALGISRGHKFLGPD